MTSHDTRDFFVGLAVAQRLGRPATPTDQAWIESLFGHVKGEWPHLETITDPAALHTELGRVAESTTGPACTPGSATSHPTTNTPAEEKPSAKHESRDCGEPTNSAYLPSPPPQQPPRGDGMIGSLSSRSRFNQRGNPCRAATPNAPSYRRHGQHRRHGHPHPGRLHQPVHDHHRQHPRHGQYQPPHRRQTPPDPTQHARRPHRSPSHIDKQYDATATAADDKDTGTVHASGQAPIRGSGPDMTDRTI